MTIQWLLTDNSEPPELDDELNPLPRPVVEVMSEEELVVHFSSLTAKKPHVVVLSSTGGESVVVGVGPEFGWMTYYPTEVGGAFTFLPRSSSATHVLEFRSEAGMTEVLPQHLLPMSDVIKLLQLLCFHMVPSLAGEPELNAPS